MSLWAETSPKQKTPQVNNKMTDKRKKLLLPGLIVIVTAFTIYFINKNPPEAQRGFQQKAAKIVVKAQTIAPQQYQVQIESYGLVKPRTQSVLVSQVAGQIIEISPHFREGGFFEKGEVLVQIDDRDHLVDVKTAQANVLSAQQALLEEEAKGQQAITDWQRLGNGKEASSLVLRQPQLEAAKATLLSVQADLDKAKLNLERTKVIAPFAGRVLSKSVDIGQVVSNNSELADIFAIDSVEIRLPIKNKDLMLMDLPEQYRDNSPVQNQSNVVFYSDLIGEQQWQGRLVRTEGAIDTGAQQLYVVAQIDDPYQATQTNKYPVKIGQYVRAKISGRLLDNIMLIPNSAIYQGSYVYTEQDGILKRKNIQIQWQNAQQSIIKSGLEFGDKLVLTPLGAVSSGTAVSVKPESTAVSPSGDAS